MTLSIPLIDALIEHTRGPELMRLRVRSDVESGEIYTSRGRIVAAFSGHLVGREAIFALLFEAARCVEASQVNQVPASAAERRFVSLPTALMVMQFKNLLRRWTELRKKKLVVAPELDSGDLDAASQDLLMWFVDVIVAESALDAAGVRIGGTLERLAKLVDDGFLQPAKASRSKMGNATSPFIPSITPELLAGFMDGFTHAKTQTEEKAVKPKSSRFLARDVRPAETEGAVKTTLASTDIELVFSASRERWASVSERLQSFLSVGKRLASFEMAVPHEALTFEVVPTLLYTGDCAKIGLDTLKQLMLLSPRPVAWMYGDGEDNARMAIEAMRHGAAFALPDRVDRLALTELIGDLRNLPKTCVIRRLKQIGKPATAQTGDRFGVVCASRSSGTALLEVLCNTTPNSAAPLLVVHALATGLQASLEAFINTNSVFRVTPDDKVRRGQVKLLHVAEPLPEVAWNDVGDALVLQGGRAHRVWGWLNRVAARNPKKVIGLILGEESALGPTDDPAPFTRHLIRWQRGEDMIPTPFEEIANFKDLSTSFSEAFFK